MCQHHTTPYTQLPVVEFVLCTEALLSLYCVLYFVHCIGVHTYTLLSAVCVRLLLCRPNRPLPNPVYEYEYMGSGSGGVALASMTENPAYVTAGEVVTGFSSGPEEDKEKDHTYEVLPFEANEEMVQGDTTQGDQREAPDPMYI